MPQRPQPAIIEQDVARALDEDVGPGDLTASLLPEDALLTTDVICREDAVLAGRDWFDETFRQLDGEVTIKWVHHDGDRLQPGTRLCRLSGPARTILTGERTALNFLQTLSSTATLTAAYVKRIAHTRTKVLDTRKTLPGLRRAQKYAVLCGGGTNHRIGLYDALLIKENHIAAAGSINAAVSAAKMLHPGKPIEVEVENLDQLDQAVTAGAHRVLLDNYPVKDLISAVEKYSGGVELEASGNITLDTIAEVAETGVDFISTGAITKNVLAVDFSMRFA